MKQKPHLRIVASNDKKVSYYTRLEQELDKEIHRRYVRELTQQRTKMQLTPDEEKGGE